MSKNKENNDDLKELAIPYIGIKVESIPTILRILNESKDDDEFIKYFLDIGKQKKTAMEYLASLRNLKLAEKDKNGKTKVTSIGVNLLKDDIDLLYKNLLKHCLKCFPDLKIVKDVIKNNYPKTLKELIKQLEKIGYKVNREQTLSSYYKFFYESNIPLDKIRRPHVKSKERVEFQSFVKYILAVARDKKTENIEIAELRNYLSKKLGSEVEFSENTLKEYLKTLDLERKIRLYPINSKLSDENSYIEINGKIYYYFEVIKNAF